MGRPVKPPRGEGLPRGMRADTAAWYLGMSETTFLRMVADKQMPPGVPMNGMLIWDRFELDVAFEDWKARRKKKRNSINEILGVKDDQAQGDD